MGSGIAQVAATAGYDVSLVEVDPNLVEKAKENIKKNLVRVARKQFKENEDAQAKFISQTMSRVKGTADLKECVKETDLVIEAIVENMKIKHEIFSTIDQVAPSHTILASNTSSLPITEIASVTKRKDRFAGMHFFNPVPIMKLLEIIRIPDTSNETYKKVVAVGEAMGKTCITCKDTPGFVVNRLLIPYVAEAVRMLERGDASSRDIDTAMKLGAGHPMGPIELADYVGLDTTQSILKGWHEKFPENPLFNPIQKLNQLVSEKKFGVKSGEGFYKYNNK